MVMVMVIRGIVPIVTITIGLRDTMKRMMSQAPPRAPAAKTSDKGQTHVRVKSSSRTPTAALCEEVASRVLDKPILSWQREWWHECCRRDIPRDLLYLSCARGAGKSAVAAALAAAWALCKPPKADIIIVSGSFEMAKIVGRDAREMMGDAPGWRWRNSQQRFEASHRESGTRLRVIGSNPNRLHGLRPALICVDEVAVLQQGPLMLGVLSTALGKFPGARMVLIGTRAGDPMHHWEVALNNPDPRSHVTMFAADPDCDYADETQWMKANPSLEANNLPSINLLRREFAKAQRDPAQMQLFKALRLNLGVDIVENTASLLSPGVWEDLPDPDEPDDEPEWICGLDVGGNVSLSGLAFYAPDLGRLETLAAIGGIPSLVERGKKFGAPHLFVDAQKQGHLLVSKNRNSDPAALLSEAIARWGVPEVIVADRYKSALVLDILDELGVNCEMVWRGQGWRDGAEDTARFIRACHDGKVKPVRTELLDVSIVSARLMTSPSGDQKLGHRAERPDDLASACIAAVSEGARRGASRPTLRFATI